MTNFKVPGVFWIALIAFVVRWLPELAPDAPWLPTVSLVLLALLKAVEVVVTPPPASIDVSTDRAAEPGAVSQARRLVRWLLG